MTTRFTQYWTAEVTFKTLTDLHVGAGDIGELADNNSDGEARQYALCARNHSNNPCIPGSGLKGALRALAGKDANFLFGSSPKEGTEGETGTGGRLVPMMAGLSNILTHDDLPHWNSQKQSWIRIRHARDRVTMAVDAENHKLFNAELVPPDAKFTGELLFMGSEDELNNHVLRLLKRLSRAKGFSLGASRNVMGKVRLVPGTVTFAGRAMVKEMRDDGHVHIALKKTTIELNLPFSSEQVPNLSLKFPGPVAILDPERSKEVTTGDKTQKIQQVLQYGTDSLAGFETALRQALRQRCAWLEVSQTWDSRDCLDDPDRVLKPHDEIKDLTATQRLFGVTGLRGLLSCHPVSAKGEKSQTFPGIALDRLTSGLLHGATFFIEAPVDVTANLRLELDAKRHANAVYNSVREADFKLFQRLSADVSRRGIKLGRHVSSGFGWSEGFDLPAAGTPEAGKRADNA